MPFFHAARLRDFGGRDAVAAAPAALKTPMLVTSQMEKMTSLWRFPKRKFSGFTHEISMVIIQLIIDILISLDWCKRKLTGNHIYFLR